MSVEAQIRAAKSPGEALLILARAIDASAPAAPAEDWVIPDAPTDAVAALREQLASVSDEQERVSLEAKLRLLTDDGGTVEDVTSDDGRTQTTGPDTDVTVMLPPASDDERDARRGWAKTLFADGWPEGLDQAAAIAAFVAGGPLWLYYARRSYAMSLPPATRQQLVAAIAGTVSQRELQEIGRDLLKSGANESREFAMESLDV